MDEGLAESVVIIDQHPPFSTLSFAMLFKEEIFNRGISEINQMNFYFTYEDVGNIPNRHQKPTTIKSINLIISNFGLQLRSRILSKICLPGTLCTHSQILMYPSIIEEATSCNNHL